MSSTPKCPVGPHPVLVVSEQEAIFYRTRVTGAVVTSTIRDHVSEVPTGATFVYMTETVGIRELRQNLSRYLDRVKDGDRLLVTERNRPVAMLGPLPEHDDPLERLIAAGLVRPATRSIADLPPPIKVGGDPYGLSKALDETRGDR